MGYDTTEYYMYGIKVPEYFEEFKELYFADALNLFADIDVADLGEEDKVVIQKLKDFWEPLNEWYDFEQATDLSVRYAGDARFEVHFVFMGEDISLMGDDQTKNQFAASIKQRILAVIGLNSDYGLNSITDEEGFEWCSFAWTC